MAKSGVHRLLVGDITQSKLKGQALIDALGAMNSSADASKEKLSKGVKKAKKK